ncbi:hypothetical protein TEA_019397 [Camellia sinensis var. sinensis]|uniref:Uncharacterized protein n=1 Tax=Camellia sinensis var. sinensis TaxID=542762 RepID=A0A4S4DS60_CAMSN|nr:hypothetical protein TEA_019397 [Camellia sinensis var. sinensis]
MGLERERKRGAFSGASEAKPLQLSDGTAIGEGIIGGVFYGKKTILYYRVIGAFQDITKLYTEDWIGLKTLDEAGKVKFINVSGGHLHISPSDIEKYIVPYLLDEASIQLAKIAKPYHGE